MVEQDTTIYYCKQEMPAGVGETGGWRSYIFKCSCKALDGSITSCNGKQSVDVTQDCTPYRGPLDGDCSQNGYQSGSNGAPDSTGGTASCYAALGADCVMKDKASGNTFTCAGCDGSCDYALRKMATGECTNPYPQPQQSGDTIILPPTSYEPPPWSSSSGAAEPPQSFGNEQAALNAMYGVLDTIRDTLNRGVMPSLRMVQANTQQANEYLQQIANKDWNPTINVGAPVVNVAGDTNIVNVNVQTDTAHSPAAIFGLLLDKLGGGEPNSADTAGTGAQMAGIMGSIDSLLADGVPDMTDSIGGAVQGTRAAFAVLRDTLANGAFNDSVTRWQGMLVDNGVITGNGSDNCPNVLQRTWDVSLGIGGTMEVGPLGKYLCAVVPGVGVTFWALARVIIRAVVSILCMMWIFKSVMGIDGGGSDED